MEVLLAASPPLGPTTSADSGGTLSETTGYFDSFDTSVTSPPIKVKRRIRTTARNLIVALDRDWGARHRMLSA
jgi:hypothetical protein